MNSYYKAIKESVNSIIKIYVENNKGEVYPLNEEKANIPLDYFGDTTDHKLIALRLIGNEQEVVVDSIVDGERTTDFFDHFSNEEMMRIAFAFLPTE